MTAASQLALGLQPKFSWGGARPGAGRPRGERVSHLHRPDIRNRFPVHVTLKVREDVPSLRSVKLVRELERSWGRASTRPGFRLVHYTLQGDHAHLIVEASDAESLGAGMKSIGARLARAVNRIFGRQGPVLADRFHHRALKTPKQVRNALAYVLLNGRRHAKKNGDRPVVDPASSGRWFEGWRQQPIVPNAVLRWGLRTSPVARARTWLLKQGWRRHGLIDPTEVPGHESKKRRRPHPRRHR